MPDIKILKPAVEGTTVRDPVTREKLPAEGKAVRMNTFWNRRLDDGSVIEIPLQNGPGRLGQPKPKE